MLTTLATPIATPVTSPESLARFCTAEQLPPLSPDEVAGQQADAHWLLRDGQGTITARCSLWWQQTPNYPGHQVGLIGHFAAAQPEAGVQLLRLACRQLAAHGCTLAIGPMAGNTWRPYRLVTEQSSEPPFFLEPDNPADWPGQFTAAGFTVLASYVSAVDDDLTRPTRPLERIAARVQQRGIRLRPFQPQAFEPELRKLHAVATASFSHNFLYTPLDFPEFAAMYTPLRPYLQPDLILIAEQADRPVGFLFALPDWQQARCGQPVNTVIFKTVAVDPAYQTLGLGSLLVDCCRQTARRLGFRRAIHALMHQSNASRKMSSRNHGRIIRRYALFSREL